jgi:hypothetical protein
VIARKKTKKIFKYPLGRLARYGINGIIYTSNKQNALYNSLNGASGQLQSAISGSVWYHTVFLTIPWMN